MRLPPEIKDSVTFLYTEIDGKRSPIGTAFFVYVDEDDETFAYLITCKHVVMPVLDMGLPVDIRLNRSDRRDVDYQRVSNYWLYHEDKAVDLAVLPWKPAPGGLPLNITAFKFDRILLTDELLTRYNHRLTEAMKSLSLAYFLITPDMNEMCLSFVPDGSL